MCPLGDFKRIKVWTKRIQQQETMLSLSSEAYFLSEADSHIQANLEDSVVQQVSTSLLLFSKKSFALKLSTPYRP